MIRLLFCLISALALSLARAEEPALTGPLTITEQSSTGIVINSHGGRLELRPLLPNTLRIRFTRGNSPEEPSVVLTEQVPVPKFSVQVTSHSITVDLPQVHASVDRRSGLISFSDPDGRIFLREVPGRPRIEASRLHGSPTYAVAQCFDSPVGEGLFGTGQFQDGFLNIRDLPRRLTQVNTQIAIPFVVSSRGFGLLWHNTGLTEFNPADERIALVATEREGTSSEVEITTTEGVRREKRDEGVFVGKFKTSVVGSHAFLLDVGQKMARRWYVEIDGRPAVDFENLWLPPTTSWFSELPPGEHTVRILGAKEDRPVLSFRPSQALMEFRSPTAEALDYLVIAGQGDQITDAYRRLTGPAPLLPAWAFGYIHCRERYKSQEELLQNVAEFRRRHLPLDVIVQDWQYWGRHGWNAMRFDETDYPAPGEMIQQLHAQDTRLMLSVWSKIDPRSELGREFVARDYFIPGTQWVDFFNPKASSFYWENVRTRLLPLGIDAWWLDATEPENDDLVGRQTYAGAGEKNRNSYPLFVTRTVYEGLRKDDPDRRAFILTRSAFLGQQRYAAATWSGDIGNSWETLRRQIPAGLNYVITGLPWWTTDTGGFFRPGSSQYTDPEYQERALRWLQYSTFTPLQRVHGFQSNTEPWRYGELYENETRRWLRLRYRLMPYLYSEAARVSFHGSTLMRPLVLDFSNDPLALAQQYEFMFGPALLVAPVLESGVKQWPVYLPKSSAGWFDFWNGEFHNGGSSISVAAALDRIPLHVRAGSILPLGPELEHTGEKPADPIELRIYTGTDADYVLYEDKGTDYSYEKGARSTIPFHWNQKAKVLRIGPRVGAFAGMPGTRVFTITWVRPGHGIGDRSTMPPDALVTYSGGILEVPLPPGVKLTKP